MAQTSPNTVSVNAYVNFSSLSSALNFLLNFLKTRGDLTKTGKLTKLQHVTSFPSHIYNLSVVCLPRNCTLPLSASVHPAMMSVRCGAVWSGAVRCNNQSYPWQDPPVGHRATFAVRCRAPVVVAISLPVPRDWLRRPNKSCMFVYINVYEFLSTMRADRT